MTIKKIISLTKKLKKRKISQIKILINQRI